jgi:hypothetical protein
VHRGRVVRSSRAPGADGPYGLVRNDCLEHLLAAERREARAELVEDDVLRLPMLALLDLLADAQHGHHAVLHHLRDLARGLGVRLAEDVPALGVPHEHVPRSRVGRHGGGRLARERALLLEVHVLHAARDVGSCERSGASALERDG